MMRFSAGVRNRKDMPSLCLKHTDKYKTHQARKLHTKTPNHDTPNSFTLNFPVMNFSEAVSLQKFYAIVLFTFIYFFLFCLQFFLISLLCGSGNNQLMFLIMCSKLRPSMMQHLLRRLVFDVPLLNEHTKMPLKVRTQECFSNECAGTLHV